MLAFTREMYQHSQYRHPDKGFHYIATGMNVCPYTVTKQTNQKMVCKLKRFEWESEVVSKLPTVYEFLSKEIHNEE